MMLWIILMCAQASGCEAMQAPSIDNGHFLQGTAYSTRQICEKEITGIYGGQKIRPHVFKVFGYLDICKPEWVSADDDKWASGDAGVAAVAAEVGAGPASQPERQQKPTNDFPFPRPNVLDLPSIDAFYPRRDTQRGTQGTVIVKICVGPSGTFSEPPSLVTSSGHRGLDQAALRWAQATSGHWQPAIKNDVPVSACGELPVKFQLTDTY